MNRCSTHRCIRVFCLETCFSTEKFDINSNGKCKHKHRHRHRHRHRHMCFTNVYTFAHALKKNIQSLRILSCCFSMMKPESPVNVSSCFAKENKLEREEKSER